MHSPEWKVYYDGTIYGHSGKSKAGIEIPIEKEFSFAGRTWIVPAAYSCTKGLVIDFCMRVDLDKFKAYWAKWSDKYDDRLNGRERMLSYLENPLHFEFAPKVTVNGKTLKRRNSSGICYIPGDSSEQETRYIAEHYHLNQNFAWSLSRVCFPWSSARRPEIKSMELTMIQEPVRVPGKVFEATRPGEQIDLEIPGHPITLTVKDIEPQNLDTSMISADGMEYPFCYSVLMEAYVLSNQVAGKILI